MASHNSDSGPSVRLRTALGGAFDVLHARYCREGGATGTLTGFPSLDRLTNGLQPGELTLLAARSGMGKTTLALDVATNVALARGGVFVYSLQMSAAQIAIRLISALTRIPWDRIRSGQLKDDDWSEISAAIRQLKDTSLEIGITSRDVLAGLWGQALRMAQNCDIDLIIIDDLDGLVRAQKQSSSRRLVTLETMRSLKLLALKCEAPVVLLSGLRRRLVTGRERRPILSDIRSFHKIRSHLDTVMFLYREDCYGNRPFKNGTTEVIVPLQENGSPAATTFLMFAEKRIHFEDIEEH